MANPAANARVGNVVPLSSLSPAAVEMYDIVKGSRPQTHGETEVKSPAPYITGIEEKKLDGSCNDVDANEEAADCALKTNSSQFADTSTAVFCRVFRIDGFDFTAFSDAVLGKFTKAVENGRQKTASTTMLNIIFRFLSSLLGGKEPSIDGRFRMAEETDIVILTCSLVQTR